MSCKIGLHGKMRHPDIGVIKVNYDILDKIKKARLDY